MTIGKAPEVFIPERYLLHKEILVCVEGLGYGMVVTIPDLPGLMRAGRVHSKVISDNAQVLIQHHIHRIVT